MPPGIDPKVDFAFKLVFGSPDHTNITIHFLNAVLNFDPPITSVEILNPLQGKDHSEDKLIVLDVLAVDELGRRFNIEMQTTLPSDLAKRLTYYNCVNYVRQLNEGERYFELRPSICICVLDRVLFRYVDEFHLSHRLRCDQTDLVFSDDLVFHTLELPKYQVDRDNVILNDPLSKWLYFLKYAKQLDSNELAEQLVDDEYREALGVLNMISQSPQDRQFYEARMKFLHDAEARLIFARSEGHAEGRAERQAEARTEGQTEGIVAAKIQFLQQDMSLDETPMDDLLQKDLAVLTRTYSELQNEFRARGEE
jgi:predicted transposase/invertase (TIGR01784 family)